MQKLIAKVQNTPVGPKKQLLFSEPVHHSILMALAKDLNLTPDTPSSEYRSTSWASDNESILLEAGYGITFDEEEEARVKQAIAWYDEEFKLN